MNDDPPPAPVDGTAPGAPTPTPRPPGRFERLAGSRAALAMLCVLSFADACCSPILPEVLYVPMVLLEPQRRWVFAFWTSTMSVLGGVAGYGLGYLLWAHGLREFAYEHVPGFTPESFAEISALYGDNAFLWVWLGGLTPLPYKVFTVFAGVCSHQVDFGIFMLASVTSRFPRIYATVWLLHRLGKPTFQLVTRRFRTVALVTVLAAVVAFVVWTQWA